MQKAKIIGGEGKTSNARRVGVAAVIAFVAVLLVATAMPMANIPGFSRLAAALGLTPDSARHLTLGDLAAYAAGVEGNRVSAAQWNYGYAPGAGSAYDRSGGLAPVTMPGQNRLLDAQEAYRREYALTGRYSPIQTAQAGAADFAGVGMLAAAGNPNAPIISGERVGPGGEYGPGFGSAIGAAGDAIIPAGAPGSAGRAVLKPISPFDFEATGNDARSTDVMLEDIALKMRGGRLGAMGGFTALASRVNPSLGNMGQLGAFGDVGRSYFFSYSAGATGYKTTAKQLAEAAFDGSEMEPETIILPGETEEKVVSSLDKAPSTVVSKMNAAMNMCSDAREQYQSVGTRARESLNQIRGQLEEQDWKSSTGIPGSCSGGVFGNRPQPALRQAWNQLIDGMIDACEEYQDALKNFSGKCGINYNPHPNPYTCRDLRDFKTKGMSSGGNFLNWGTGGGACKNNSISATTGNRITFADFQARYAATMEGEFKGAVRGSAWL